MRVENLKRRTGLKRKQVELLAVIYSLSKQRGYCYAPKQDMARWLNMSETDIYNQLNALEEMGFIYRVKPHRNKIFVDQKALESFCQYKSPELIGMNEMHLYVNVPYWLFSLTDIDPEEYVVYCEKFRKGEIENERLNADDTSIPDWVKELGIEINDND